MGVIDGGQVARHALFAVAVGVAGAAASIVLCLCVGLAWDAYQACWQLIFALPALGILSLLLYRAWHLPLDMTTHKVVGYIRDDREVSPWLAPGILIGTCLSILGGASVGKEAGALHMGASLGDLVARPFKLRPVHRADAGQSMAGYAAATGMAAAFAALFFAPLGSCMFVLELARFKRTVTKHLLSILLACFVAFALASAVGIGDVIPKVALPALSWPAVGQCAVIGVACAIVGTLFVKAIDGLQRVTARRSRDYYLWVAAGGLLIAGLTLAFGWQPFGGTGGPLLADALAGRAGTWDFAVKAVVTALALGLWFKGGEIMPSFTIGALLGASCTAMTGGDAGWSAAVGVVAFFAAMSRCPLAAILMGCEIFGWEGAPLFAIAVAVSFPFGRDVGMYGLGATSAVYHLGRAAALRVRDPERAAVVSAAVGAADRAIVDERARQTGAAPAAPARADRRAVADALSQDVERAHRAMGAIEAELERRHEPTSGSQG
ncbi:chloride channel protein [Adlercreutzia faecimuris]|uniref:Chloride channel protein n=1 Tax=Adlercreutzia faecimuris TaxID=2897341 RepID=A0ABS9WHB1_9ACTN|nr:chloride channel protein [Adlercreutzia sp. JBNU-10]MCI2242254.1 chloride channel protein [Adlercreutzia sp. JBNU-10]